MEAPERPRTRRSVLTAAAAGVAAAAASSLARPGLVSAHDVDDVWLGHSNPTTATTSISNTSNNNVVLDIYSSQASQAFTVNNETGTAVFGNSFNAYGVVGNGATGVLGQNIVGDGIGVDGKSYGSSGVGARGWASSTSGATVGVVGRSDSASGFGVLARNTAAGGTAFEADGKVRFKRSGKATIAAGARSKKVTLAGVAASSMVLAVLAQGRSGRWVRAVVPASGYFTIYLNTSVSSKTKVSWFVLDPFI